MTNQKSLISVSRFMQGGCAMAACMLAPGLHAQDTRPASSTTLEEIIVTADRQNTLNIQEAPIAISVVNTEALTREGAQGFNDYLEAQPSVFLQESGPGQNKFVIRGMSISPFNHTILHDRALVSVYLDDTPISLQGNTPDLKIYDLERVEIIRGPQGTLYGAGAMAGNIRLITIKPQTDEFDAWAETTVGGSAQGGTDFSVRGMANIPVADTVALRLNAYRGENSGYIDNIGIGKEDANSDETTQARAALRWTPTDSLTLDVNHTFARLRAHGESVIRREVTIPPQPFDSNNTNIPEAYNDDFNLSNITASFQFDSVELISSTSYTDRDFDRITSGQYLIGRRGLGLGHVPYGSIDSRNDIQNTYQGFTQEIRLQSRGEQRFRWITGLYYERQDRTQLQDIPTPGYDAQAFVVGLGGLVGLASSTDLGTPGPDTPFYGDTDIEDRQWAVFGEATYELLPGLDVTLGARYFDYQQDFDLYFAGILGISFDNLLPLEAVDTLEESDVNPRLAVSYQATDDLLIFAEAARGFRYGGTNQPIPESCGEPGPLSFESDSVWTYQLGEKSTLLDGRLTLNLTAFLTDWEDVQVDRILAECSYLYTANSQSGEVRSQGLELESRARLTDSLLFSLNASYVDIEANGDITFASQTAGAPPFVVGLDGQRAPGTPRYSGSVALDYSVPAFMAGSLDLHAAYQYREGYFSGWDPVNPATTRTPLHRRIDFAANYLSGGAWEAGVYVRNVTDEEEFFSVGSSRRANNQPFLETKTVGRGRTYGVRLRYNF